MQKKRKLIILIAIPLVIIICSLFLLYLPMTGMSSGVPQGICSVDTLLLDQSAFQSDTHMSFTRDFEDFALVSADHTFLSKDIDVDHRIEYYNTQFSAWQAYMYNYGVFKKSKYNDSWIKPNEVTFSSQTADQYHFACTHDTVFGGQCMLTARYGRYFVFLRTNLSKEFGIENVQPLLQKIDTLMSPCISK